MKLPDRMNLGVGANLLSKLAAVAWAGVLIVALALSNYSLYFVGHHFGLPVYFAYGLSVPYDGAALVLADTSLKYARERGANGSASRLAVLVLAGLSAWLNSYHATVLHYGIPGHVMFATPPLIAVFLFENHIRYERRDALKAAGRVSPPPPVLGLPRWLLFPGRSIKLYKAAVWEGTSVISEALADPAALLADLTTKADAVRVAAAYAGSEPVHVLAWLNAHSRHLPGSLRGYSLPAVTQYLQRDQARALDSGTAPAVPELPAATVAELPAAPDAPEPSWLRTGILPGAVQPGDVATLGCGHLVQAERILRLGDMHACHVCKAPVPYLGGMRLNELLDSNTTQAPA